MSCQQHNMTALAKLSEYSHDEDDSQYSSLALLCMREYLVPFSQQLLQTAVPSESPAEVSVCFLSHACIKVAISWQIFSVYHMLYDIPFPDLFLVLCIVFITSPGWLLYICNRIHHFWFCSSPFLGNKGCVLVLDCNRLHNIINGKSNILRKQNKQFFFFCITFHRPKNIACLCFRSIKNW